MSKDEQIEELRAGKKALQRDLAQAHDEIIELRAELNSDRARLIGAIEYFLKVLQEELDESEAHVNQWIKNLHRTTQQVPVTRTVVILESIANEHHAAKGKAYATSLKEQHERFGLTEGELQNPDPYRFPLNSLAKAAALKEAATINYAMVGVLAKAHRLADHPAFVAEDIMSECDKYGEPHMETLHRLKLDWVKANLPDDPPASYKTLHKALKRAHAFTKSGKTMVQYCGANHFELGPRTLGQYVSWYNKLKEIVNTKPDLWGYATEN
jgi:hypothetical protein